jgi:tetratricopeptide (TPR) repeat protein
MSHIHNAASREPDGGARPSTPALVARLALVLALTLALTTLGCGKDKHTPERSSSAAGPPTTPPQPGSAPAATSGPAPAQVPAGSPAPQSPPPGESSHVGIALSLLRGGQVDAGLDELRKAPPAEHGAATSPFWVPEVAQILAGQRRLTTADSLLRAYPKAVTDNAGLEVLAARLASTLGRPDEAAERFREAMSDSRVLVDAATDLARLEFERKHFADAADAAQQALAHQPTNQAARLLLLQALLKGGRATEALSAAAALPPGAARLRFEGEALLGMGQADSAAARLRRAVKRQPGSDTAQYALGQAELACGQSAAAARVLRPLAARPHAFEDSQQLLADAYAKLGRGAVADSLRAAHVLTIKHREALALREEGLVRSGVGDLQGAFDLFQRARAQDPSISDLFNDLGAVLARMGRYPQAEQELLQAAQVSPDDPTAQRNLANLYNLTGDAQKRDEALKRWEDLTHAAQERVAAQRAAEQRAAEQRAGSQRSAGKRPATPTPAPVKKGQGSAPK